MSAPFPVPYVPGHHEEALTRHFGAAGLAFSAREATLMRANVRQTLVLCFTNRSGSNHLAECFDAAGISNTAGEFFNEDVVRDRCRSRGITSLSGYLVDLAQAETPPGGTFALKVGWHQLYLLARLGYLGVMLPNPRFVHITRRDRVAQAISLFIADRTGRWTSNHAGTGASLDVPFDGPAIAGIVQELCASDAQFEAFFAVRGVEPARVVYEDFAASPLPTVQRIARELLGVGNAAGMRLDAGKLRLAKQADALNARLAAAFRAAYMG